MLFIDLRHAVHRSTPCSPDPEVRHSPLLRHAHRARTLEERHGHDDFGYSHAGHQQVGLQAGSKHGRRAGGVKHVHTSLSIP